MRKVKIVQVEGRGEVTVKEVSPKGVYQICVAAEKMPQLQALVDDAVTPGFEELQNWYPSELEQVVEAFMEVNASFLVIARKLRVDGLITEMGQTLQSNLPPLFANLFNQATVMSGTTDGQFL